MQDILVIFDCDGVLVDSEDIACEAEAQFLTSLGYAVSKKTIIEKFLGVEKKIIAEIIKAECGIVLPQNYPQLLHKKVIELLSEHLKPIPNISNILSIIPNKCIASGAPLDRINLSLKKTNLINFFSSDAIFSTDMVSRPKPNPDIHLHICKRKDVSITKCLVIEDSVPGIKSARNAGARVLGFTGGSHAKSTSYSNKLLEAGADIVFDDMNKLFSLSEKIMKF